MNKTIEINGESFELEKFWTNGECSGELVESGYLLKPIAKREEPWKARVWTAWLYGVDYQRLTTAPRGDELHRRIRVIERPTREQVEKELREVMYADDWIDMSGFDQKNAVVSKLTAMGLLETEDSE